MKAELYTSLYSKNGTARPNLECTILKNGDDSIDIKLVNLGYKTELLNKFRSCAIFIVIYISYRILLNSIQYSGFGSSILIDVIFLLWLLYMLSSIFSLIESEKILFCPHFALQMETKKFLFRVYNNFIPISHIDDICINEVIEKLDVHYILIVRTKGALYKEKPIIPMFNALKPPVDCLKVFYKHLQQAMETGN